MGHCKIKANKCGMNTHACRTPQIGKGQLFPLCRQRQVCCGTSSAFDPHTSFCRLLGDLLENHTVQAELFPDKV